MYAIRSYYGMDQQEENRTADSRSSGVMLPKITHAKGGFYGASKNDHVDIMGNSGGGPDGDIGLGHGE